MILSKTPAKIAQINALSVARSWRGNFNHVVRLIKKANAAHPISPIQWYNLAARFGTERIYEVKRLIQPKEPFQ